MRISITSRILRTAVSLCAVTSVVVVCVSLEPVRTATVVLILLLTMLIIASRWGFWEAAAATGLGAALLAYFFLPPAGWRIHSIEHWLVFFTFLIVALLGSHFAAQAKRQADEAVVRQREVERLYAFGQDLLTEGSPGSIVAACLDSLVRTFQLEAAAFYDVRTGEIARSGVKGSAISGDLFNDAAGHPDFFSERTTGTLCIRVGSEDQAVGTLAVCGGNISELTFRAIAARIETRLEQTRAQEKLRHAEVTERNQELKTALLDSLVHEIKTPLSVIKTAASSLLSKDNDTASRRELLSIIDQEADRMDASISEAFWTARVEAGTLDSGKGPHDLRPLVDETLHELRPLLESRAVTVELPDSLPPANCDSHMIKGVLKELLMNALKYSPSNSPLTISVREVGDEIITSVSDSGIGIEPGEEKLIFERHYRGTVRAPGTGLGLAIAKIIVEAHGGRIGVKSQPGAGSAFRFSLPVSHRDAA
jgi:two-component system, OmpR family, sensor histidine kinase KdpD